MKTTFDPSVSRARCLQFRKRILEVSQTVGALHIAPAFSCLELVESAYFGLMNLTGNRETDDTFVMSKGHGSLAQFLALEELGVIPKEWLENFCRPGYPLATHPDYGTPGVEASTGSLGHGLGLAVGMAYADRMKKIERDIFVVMSDGELMEGSVWEALMVAPSFGVKRIIAMVDLNDFQSLGQTSKTLPNFYPVVEKVAAFGWEVVEVNGHNVEEIHSAVKARSGKKPFLLLGRTTKGKGVSYMENVPVWHYRSPSPEEFKQAMQELKEIRG
jgi:transketolase